MTDDDRAEKLARAFAAPKEPGRIDRLYAEVALAAVDADPAAYGYRRINPPMTVTLSEQEKAYIKRMGPHT